MEEKRSNNFFITWMVSTVTILLMSEVFNGFYVEDIKTAILVSLLISILNLLVKPILLILTFPITIMTLGLFYFVVNGMIIMLASELMSPKFEVKSMTMAILASCIISLTKKMSKDD